MAEGAMNFAKVLNICPMNPSRVQFPMAMVPPGLHTRGGDELTVVSSEYLEVIAVKA
jgi:hypothetical protein